MDSYKLNKEAEKDLIRIHQFEVKKFGIAQADKYFEAFCENFDIIAQRPFSFESVDFIKTGYRRCVSGSDSFYFKVNNDTVEILTIIGQQDMRNVQ